MSKLKPPVSDKDQQTGNPDSKIVLVEFGDYQCPHCGHAHPLLKELLQKKGKEFAFVFRNFPIQESHAADFMAAMAAEAAAVQDKFWPMHDMIYENQQDLHGNSFLEFARRLSLDEHQFGKDWQSETIRQKIEADFESGIRSGVNGTPTFYINGERVAYDGSYESLAEAINAQKKMVK